MAFVSNNNTSLITILSSHHGQLRREQRDIDKRDLQRALKHGIPERVWGQRWKVAYDGITFITDYTMRREVTAYPSPLPPMEIDWEMQHAHDSARRLLHQKPELATSHTVVLIDNSGSMLDKKNNVHLYRDSQNAAFSMTALEFVADQLFNKTAVNSDLVSLVKFSDTPSVAIDREPIGWPVYNMFLSHRNTDTFVNRKLSPFYDEYHSQSNFLPALKKAKELLQTGHHDAAPVSLFFFSDGQSTDSDRLGIHRTQARMQMCNEIKDMAAEFGETFTVTMVGLGNLADDFSDLQGMAQAATDAGAKGSFEFCQKTANAIQSAVSSLVTSTTESKLALRQGGASKFTQRDDLVKEDDATVKFDWQYFPIAEHFVYDPNRRDFLLEAALPLAAAHSNPREALRRRSNPPSYLAVNKNYFGKGAERVAFRCRLSDKDRADGFVFDSMIAKETSHVERFDEKVDFHRKFVETQDLASFLATQFNQHLRALPHYEKYPTPQLLFLSCSVLVVNSEGNHRGFLVEKKLDVERFPWTKWNDNNGMVDGKQIHVPLDVDFELKQLEKEKANKSTPGGLLGAITEEEEEEEESDDDDSVSDLEAEAEENHNDGQNDHGAAARDSLGAG